MFGPIGVPELVVLSLGIVGGLFWIWMLVDCATKGPAENKAVWVVVIALGSIFGAVAYFFLGRQRLG